MPSCSRARLSVSSSSSSSTAGRSTPASRAGNGGTVNILGASCRSSASGPWRTLRTPPAGSWLAVRLS
eukprot:7734566-Alexandrium_andersonii.AAC.1